MAIGVVIDQAIAEPDHAVKPQIARQLRLDLAARPVGVAVGTQQALLGGQNRSAPIPVDRAAFQYPIRFHYRQPRLARHLGYDRLVSGNLLLAAPTFQPATQCRPVAAHTRPDLTPPTLA